MNAGSRPSLSPGDRVKATLKGTCIEGEVTFVWTGFGGFNLQPDGLIDHRAFYTLPLFWSDGWHVEKLPPPLPPEPPAGWIGRGRNDGKTWDHREDVDGRYPRCWRTADGAFPGLYTWPEVCARNPDGLSPLVDADEIAEWLRMFQPSGSEIAKLLLERFGGAK